MVSKAKSGQQRAYPSQYQICRLLLRKLLAVRAAVVAHVSAGS